MKAKAHSIEFYKSGFFRKDWRWRIKANNGNIIGASSEGYRNKKDCIYNALSVAESINSGIDIGQL